jgi:hypothetical protein
LGWSHAASPRGPNLSKALEGSLNSIRAGGQPIPKPPTSQVQSVRVSTGANSAEPPPSSTHGSLSRVLITPNLWIGSQLAFEGVYSQGIRKSHRKLVSPLISPFSPPSGPPYMVEVFRRGEVYLRGLIPPSVRLGQPDTHPRPWTHSDYLAFPLPARLSPLSCISVPFPHPFRFVWTFMKLVEKPDPPKHLIFS